MVIQYSSKGQRYTFDVAAEGCSHLLCATKAACKYANALLWRRNFPSPKQPANQHHQQTDPDTNGIISLNYCLQSFD
jgi:hypothetical protein